MDGHRLQCTKSSDDDLCAFAIRHGTSAVLRGRSHEFVVSTLRYLLLSICLTDKRLLKNVWHHVAREYHPIPGRLVHAVSKKRWFFFSLVVTGGITPFPGLGCSIPQKRDRISMDSCGAYGSCHSRRVIHVKTVGVFFFLFFCVPSL